MTLYKKRGEKIPTNPHPDTQPQGLKTSQRAQSSELIFLSQIQLSHFVMAKLKSCQSQPNFIKIRLSQPHLSKRQVPESG